MSDKRTHPVVMNENVLGNMMFLTLVGVTIEHNPDWNKHVAAITGSVAREIFSD